MNRQERAWRVAKMTAACDQAQTREHAALQAQLPQRTRILTRQTLHQGTEELLIAHSAGGFHVIHVDAKQQCTALPQGRYGDYGAAHDRLQQEYQERRQA